jgi:serine/threonine-protein kinase
MLRVALGRGIAWEPRDRPGSVTELCEELRLDEQLRLYTEKLRLRAASHKPGEERLHRIDETLLLFVPGGEYILGAEDIGEEEKPIHRAILSPFWIAKYPVTNEQYGRFLRANPLARSPQYWTEGWFNQPQQPVVGVSWEEAKAYCRWASLRLPSEAQWEAAARGTDGRHYPWGSAEPMPVHANFDNREGRPSRVGSYPRGAGPFGALDQAGNVWEWCEDIWDESAYQERNGQRDPLSFTGYTAARCLRGGSWDRGAWVLAAACRSWVEASWRSERIGFRCVLPAYPSHDSP